MDRVCTSFGGKVKNDLMLFIDWHIYILNPQICNVLVYIDYSSDELNFTNLTLKSLINLNCADKSI